jgi:hypothetical protein
MKKINLIKQPIILAPRGEFSEGSINTKRFKKMYFIRLVKFLKLYDNIVWHASSKHEKEDIMRLFKHAEVETAMNLSKPTLYNNHKKKESR